MNGTFVESLVWADHGGSGGVTPFLLWLCVVLMLCVAHNPLLWHGTYHNLFDSSVKDDLVIEDIIPNLRSVRESLPEVAESDEKFHADKKLIAVNGYWYDVTNFLEKHPGGPIIKKFVGADVTSTFYGMHRHADEILKKRR